MRYVLEGSVQRDRTRVRVNARSTIRARARIFGPTVRGGRRRPVRAPGSGGGAIDHSLGYELVKTEEEKDARSKSPDAVDLAMRAWALVWQNRSGSGRRRTTMRLKPCSNRRSRSTRMKPMRWRATLTPICWNTRADGHRRNRLRGKTSVRPTGPSRSPPIICGRIT